MNLPQTIGSLSNPALESILSKLIVGETPPLSYERGAGFICWFYESLRAVAYRLRCASPEVINDRSKVGEVLLGL